MVFGIMSIPDGESDCGTFVPFPTPASAPLRNADIASAKVHVLGSRYRQQQRSPRPGHCRLIETSSPKWRRNLPCIPSYGPARESPSCTTPRRGWCVAHVDVEYSSSWYYGFHLSELNFPVSSLTCSASGTSFLDLPLCLGLDQHHYGLVTAVYTVGGLLGSLGSAWLVSRQGVKGSITWTGWLNVLGAALMTFAPQWIVLGLGR